MAESGICSSKHALAQDAAMRVDQGERGVVADCSDVAQMIGKPLKLGEQRSYPDRAIRNRKLQRRLGGFRKSIGIRDGAVARYATGELCATFESGSDHQAFDALMGI